MTFGAVPRLTGPKREAIKPAPVQPATFPGQRPLARIISETAAKHGLTVTDIKAEGRQDAIVLARHEAMFRCVAETTASLPAVGIAFGGRHHTTVLHAVRSHARRNFLRLPRGMTWGRELQRGGFLPRIAALALSRHEQAIAETLALYEGRWVHRDTLIAAVWPRDGGPEAARSLLKRKIFEMRSRKLAAVGLTIEGHREHGYRLRDEDVEQVKA